MLRIYVALASVKLILPLDYISFYYVKTAVKDRHISPFFHHVRWGTKLHWIPKKRSRQFYKGLSFVHYILHACIVVLFQGRLPIKYLQNRQWAPPWRPDKGSHRFCVIGHLISSLADFETSNWFLHEFTLLLFHFVYLWRERIPLKAEKITDNIYCFFLLLLFLSLLVRFCGNSKKKKKTFFGTICFVHQSVGFWPEAQWSRWIMAI